MNRIERLRRDQSGMSYVFIGMGMMAFVGASMLAIDVGMLMTARSQAQNSADAGALAGATALLYDDFNDRSAGGPAVTSAIRGAQQNNVMGGQVSVTAADVQFVQNPTTGQNDRVKVSVRRTRLERQSGRDDDCAVLWHGQHRHRRDGDGGGRAFECDGLREAVHDSRQVD